jgi:hypothetical protein
MLDLRDLAHWDRFITPSIIRPFYALVVGLVVLYGLSGILAGLAAMAVNPFSGFVAIVISLLGVLVGVIGARIACEFVLMTFRINENLRDIALRDKEPS